MKIIYQCLTIIFLFFSPWGINAQNFDWANKCGGIVTEPIIAVDAIGNSYVSGSFTDTTYFGVVSLISAGDYDIFLCKYDSVGLLKWAFKLGANWADYANDISSDSAGNVYLTGEFYGPVDFGGVILTGNGPFIAKYNSTGTLEWAHKIDSLQGANSVMIANNSSGKLIIGGNIYGPSDFGCTLISTATPELKYIACYDTSGACLWVTTFTLEGYIVDISIDNADNAYLTGAFLNTVTFGTTVLNSSGSQDVYLAKCNANGSWEWALSAGSTDFDQGLGVSADNFGHIFLTGYFRLTVSFGCASYTSTGESDIFISCFDTLGNCIWVRQAGGGFGNQYPFGITSDVYGNCTITGSIIDTTHFGNFTLIPNGEKMYVAKYDSSGLCEWATEATGISGDRGTDIGTDYSGNIYVTGPLWTSGVHTFGNYSLVANYYGGGFIGYDIFLAKINSLSTEIPNIQPSISNFNLFPNPTKDNVQISFDTKEKSNLHCKIINLLGETIFEQNLMANPTRNDFTFNLSSLRNGMYFLDLNFEGESIILKIVRE